MNAPTRLLVFACVYLIPGAGAGVPAGEIAAEDLAFFESAIRPLLVDRCQKCHSGDRPKGGLRLDSREALLAGGDLGPAVVPGRPEESLLIEAVNYADTLQMPPKSKLTATEIAALTRWVSQGAPWPSGALKTETGRATAEFDLNERARHWSFQPVRDVVPPDVRDPSWPWTPIDRFLLARLEATPLAPAPDTDLRTWLRRVTFDLIGLPPAPEEIAAFLRLAERDPRTATEQTVERLLASPHYGERWARHWLDLVRYAETSGHEFDYDILDAWRYRDYVIRAFNADLPFDRFVSEQIAGDLLPEPRWNPADGRHESLLGTGFYLLGEGTHSPVDLLDDEALRIDNQIDVIGKTFLGLTLACARCHDHKFDPISTRDYYALTGILKSTRHQHAFLDPPERLAPHLAELEAIKSELLAASHPSGPRATKPGSSVRSGNDASILFEDFHTDHYDGWFVTGAAFGIGPSQAGEARIQAAAKRVVPIPPGIAHSGRLSDRLQGVLRSRTFTIDRPFLHVLASGQAGRINVVIDGFEKIRSPIYGGLTVGVDSPDAFRWHTLDLGMWLGHRAYLELADGATVNYNGKNTSYFDGNGFLAVDEIRFSARREPPDPPPASTEDAPRSSEDPSLERLFAHYAEIEARIAAPALGLAMTDGTGEDAHINIRGNTKAPGETVPRRFLQVLGGADQPAPAGSGRLELARQIASPNNPLTARVLVNRLWKHHFGAGLVPSPDDFGVMGQPPSHPELLDWLAAEFIRSGWSIKHMHRLMVLSHAYRMSSRIDPSAAAVDPQNRLLHRMNVRRLEAEAVRDAMLAVSGRLDRTLFGPSIPPHLTPFMEGRGRPASSGPLDGAGRRSLYLNLRRNFLPPFLLAFDFPLPASTTGRRNISNVPAQALTLLNDPFVLDQARIWAQAQRAASTGQSADAAIDSLFLTALGRPPREAERTAIHDFLDHDHSEGWTDLCHTVLNMKEFLFID